MVCAPLLQHRNPGFGFAPPPRQPAHGADDRVADGGLPAQHLTGRTSEGYGRWLCRSTVWPWTRCRTRLDGGRAISGRLIRTPGFFLVTLNRLPPWWPSG